MGVGSILITLMCKNKVSCILFKKPLYPHHFTAKTNYYSHLYLQGAPKFEYFSLLQCFHCIFPIFRGKSLFYPKLPMTFACIKRIRRIFISLMFIAFWNLENGKKSTMIPYLRISMLLVSFDNNLPVRWSMGRFSKINCNNQPYTVHTIR